MSDRIYHAGDEVESKCNRCGDIRGHFVVALVDGEIAKVQCKTCGGTHKYRPAKPVKEAKNGVIVRNKATGAKTTAGKRMTKAQKEAEAVRQEWENTVSGTAAGEEAASEAKPYSMSGSFQEEEIISHPTFGLGVVKAVIKPNKMEVLFEAGLKTLRCVA